MVNSTNETAVGIPTILIDDVIHILWLGGIAVSWASLFTQIGFFILVPPCRKYDEKILTMLTCSRIANTMCEFVIVYVEFHNIFIKDAIFLLYFQTDFIMVCWMFVFSKNIYDKVVLVFTIRRCSLLTITLVIFFVSLPFGLLCPFILNSYPSSFDKFYSTYAFIKFVIVVINALIFVEILCVAYRRGSNMNRNISDLIKASVVSFILVCITSLQVFATDLLSFFSGKNYTVINVFCVVNSFQVVLITVIFLTLAKGKKRETAFRSTISIRLSDVNKNP